MPHNTLWATYHDQEFIVRQLRQSDSGQLTQVSLISADGVRSLALTDPAELAQVAITTGGETKPASPDAPQVCFVDHSDETNPGCFVGGLAGALAHVKAGLETLANGELLEFGFQRVDMSERELEALPVV